MYQTTHPKKTALPTLLHPRSTKRYQLLNLILGSILFILGLGGFLDPLFLGLHLSWSYSLILISAGASLCYTSFNKNSAASYYTCLIFGLIFGLIAVYGFIFGPVIDTRLFFNNDNEHLIIISRKILETRIFDHILNLVISIILLKESYQWNRP